MIRSLFLVLIAAFAVAGCSNLTDNFTLVSSVVAPGRQPVNARAAAQLQAGAPQLQVSFPSQERAGIMVLEGQRDGISSWLSADGAMLITEQGFLHGTRGFGGGMLASDVAQSRQLVLSGRTGQSTRFHTFLKGDDLTETRTYRCQVSPRGARSIQIGGQPVATRLMAEDCQSTDQAFLNLYWISKTSNRIVQSRQWAGTFLGIVATRVVPNCLQLPCALWTAEG